MKPSLLNLAKMIDHSLLHPTMTDAELRQGCAIALRCDVASACIKPYAVVMARDLLAGSDVLVGTVVGFPHGSSRVDLKVREAVAALADGAKELDMVINIGRVLGGAWDLVSEEIRRVSEFLATSSRVLCALPNPVILSERSESKNPPRFRARLMIGAPVRPSGDPSTRSSDSLAQGDRNRRP